MNWSETRKLLLQLASNRASRSIEEGDSFAALELDGDGAGESANGSGRRAASLCIASGKGGTGKSIVSASLATLFRARGPTLIVDADLGVGNAHILQDVAPAKSFVDVVEGELPVRDVVHRCLPDLDLVAGGSGVPRMAELSSYELFLIAGGLAELEQDYGYVVVDSAAGVSRQTLAFARACDLALLVTTPDLTAMTDVYAFLKLLVAGKSSARPLLLVNRARDEEEAEEVARRIARVSERFLGLAPKLVGWIPDDPAVSATVNRRGTVVALEPHAEASRALRTIAVRVLEELGRSEAHGLGRMLLCEVGYAARSRAAPARESHSAGNRASFPLVQAAWKPGPAAGSSRSSPSSPAG